MMSAWMFPPVAANPCSTCWREQASAAAERATVGGLHPFADVTSVDVAAARQTIDELHRAVEASRGVDAGHRAARVDGQTAFVVRQRPIGP